MESFFKGYAFEEELRNVEVLGEPPLKFEHDTRDELLQLIWGLLGQRRQRRIIEKFSPKDRITLLESFPPNGQLADLTSVALEQDSEEELIKYFRGLTKVQMPIETYARVAKRHLLAWRIAAFEASWHEALG